MLAVKYLEFFVRKRADSVKFNIYPSRNTCQSALLRKMGLANGGIGRRSVGRSKRKVDSSSLTPAWLQWKVLGKALSLYSYSSYAATLLA